MIVSLIYFIAKLQPPPLPFQVLKLLYHFSKLFSPKDVYDNMT